MYAKYKQGKPCDSGATGTQSKKGSKGTKKARIVPNKIKRYGCKPKEPKSELEKKHQPEKVKEKIKEKEEKARLGLDTTADVVSALLGVLEDATEEEIQGDIHVKEIDFLIPENTKKHHTNRYKSTFRKETPDLILRRGYSFRMRLTMDRPYDKDDHDINFVFKIGAAITRTNHVTVPLDEDIQDADSKIRHNWHAQLVSMDKEKNIIDVEITIAPDVIIGQWLLSIESFTKHKGEETGSLLYTSDQDILVLLNPWCPDDKCYYPTTKQLDEYVLNPIGAVYQGNYKQICAKRWRFGQFDEVVVDICLMILNKAFDWEIGTKLANPVEIARAISSIVNDCDNYGVLKGRWDGKYGDGISPTVWNGSVKILKKYDETRMPVMYGQCWVFSGIVVTVCRALGLPCKSVTNFASAHDTDGSCTKDYVWIDDPEKPGKLKQSDKHTNYSCWNFHVWNEVWMCRPDLPNGFDGWQVIDATPQERSGGRYACGPCPLAAVKEGDCVMKYDSKFVFAEVNADTIHWLITSDKKWKKLFTAKHKVGKCISTKNPDDPNTLERIDITSCYKHPEGSQRERDAVHKAISSSTADRDVEEEIHDVDIDIKDIDDVYMGSNVEIRIKVKNVCEETRNIKDMEADVFSMRYNGRCDTSPKGFIKREEFSPFELGPGEEKIIKMLIKYEDYDDKLVEQGGMEVKALALIKETGNAIVEKEDFRVRRPDVDVVISPETVAVNDEVTITMKVKNPLRRPLTKCRYTIDSESMQLNDEEFTIEKDVPANTEWCLTVKKRVWESTLFGFECITVGFDCAEIPSICGSSNTISIVW